MVLNGEASIGQVCRQKVSIHDEHDVCVLKGVAENFGPSILAVWLQLVEDLGFVGKSGNVSAKPYGFSTVVF